MALEGVRTPVAVAALVLCLLLATILRVECAQLRVGILAHRGDAVATSRWQPTFSYLSAKFEGLTFEIVPMSLAGMNAALDNGEVDLLLTNPGHFQQLARRHRLSPLANLRTDRPGQPVTGNRFGSVIFTRGDNDAITQLGDLRGRTLGAVAPDAFGGFLVAADTMLRSGINPWRDLGAVNYYGFPQDRIVQAVVAGEVDVGTVRTGILEQLIRQGVIHRADVRILNPTRIVGFELMLSTPLFPEWVIGAAQSVPEIYRRQITVELLQLESSNAAVQAGRYAGWSTVAYDGQVRALINNVEAATLAPRSDGSAQSLALSVLALALTSFALAGLLIWRREETGAAARRLFNRTKGPKVRLTPREKEILKLVEQGQTSKQIASTLGISPKTVEYHRGHLLQKFKAQNMTEVVVKATQLGAG